MKIAACLHALRHALIRLLQRPDRHRPVTVNLVLNGDLDGLNDFVDRYIDGRLR